MQGARRYSPEPDPQLQTDGREAPHPDLSKEYIVAIRYSGGIRRLMWSSKHPLPVDHPTRHVLDEHEDGLVIRDAREGKIVTTIPRHFIDEGKAFEAVGLAFQIRHMSRPRPAYMPTSYRQATPGELFLVSGTGDIVESFDPVGSRSSIARLGSQKVFHLKVRSSGVSLKSSVSMLQIEEAGERQAVPSGSRIELRGGDLDQKVFRLGNHWWRFQRIPQTDVTDILKAPRVKDEQERIFTKVMQGLVGGLFSLYLIGSLIGFPERVQKEEAKAPEPAPQVIRLRKPEPTKAPTPTKKPEPTKKPDPTKKPEAKKPEPPKAQAKKPKPVAKAPPPPPPPAPKVAPVQKPVQKPLAQNAAPVAKRPDVRPPPPKIPGLVRPSAEQQKAAAQAKIAKSLGFLSGATSKIAKLPPAYANSANRDARYQNLSEGAAQVAGKANNSMIASMAGANNRGLDFATTKGARNVKADAGVTGGYGPGGKGKALNDVQGKVSTAALYDPNAGSRMGASLGGPGGLALSGQGQISEAELMKALQKYLQKFQYCYERALLSSPALAGNLMMQWVISPGGKASQIRVVRSELNNAGLHKCVSDQLGKIPFPRPKGGSVTVKYPFTFSASTL